MSKAENPAPEKKSSMYPTTLESTTEVKGVVRKVSPRNRTDHPLEQALVDPSRDRVAEQDRPETTDKNFPGQFGESARLPIKEDAKDIVRSGTGETRYQRKARGFNERGGGFGSFTGRVEDHNRAEGASKIERPAK